MKSLRLDTEFARGLEIKTDNTIRFLVLKSIKKHTFRNRLIQKISSFTLTKDFTIFLISTFKFTKIPESIIFTKTSCSKIGHSMSNFLNNNTWVLTCLLWAPERSKPENLWTHQIKYLDELIKKLFHWFYSLFKTI